MGTHFIDIHMHVRNTTAQTLGDPKEEEVKEVVSYDLRRLVAEQPQWRERGEEFWRRFLAP